MTEVDAMKYLLSRYRKKDFENNGNKLIFNHSTACVNLRDSLQEDVKNHTLIKVNLAAVALATLSILEHSGWPIEKLEDVFTDSTEDNVRIQSLIYLKGAIKNSFSVGAHDMTIRNCKLYICHINAILKRLRYTESLPELMKAYIDMRD